jgi:hypothetical protein
MHTDLDNERSTYSPFTAFVAFNASRRELRCASDAAYMPSQERHLKALDQKPDAHGLSNNAYSDGLPGWSIKHKHVSSTVCQAYRGG